jgi:hypothetical protein
VVGVPISAAVNVLLHEPTSVPDVLFAGHVSVGAILSSTVTVAEHVLVLLHASVTVNFTVLAPRLLQLKDVLSRLNVTELQLSKLPLFICASAIVAFP